LLGLGLRQVRSLARIAKTERTGGDARVEVAKNELAHVREAEIVARRKAARLRVRKFDLEGYRMAATTK
jgi:hypothetical protein